MEKRHYYELTTAWTGNKGTGTYGYQRYDRSYTLSCKDKPAIYGSSDPAFRGDKHKYNPEELLVASLSSCHMLWYLHLCAEAGVIVVAYIDQAEAIMVESPGGGGKFEAVTLKPLVTVKSVDMVEAAKELHQKANELCFIANSVNFQVFHQAEIVHLG